MTAVLVILATGVVTASGGILLVALKAVASSKEEANAVKRASEERARADESERRRVALEAQLQHVAREYAAEKLAHDHQLEALRIEIEEMDHDLKNRPDHRADRVQRLLQKASARGRSPTSPPRGEAGDFPPRLPPGAAPNAG